MRSVSVACNFTSRIIAQKGMPIGRKDNSAAWSKEDRSIEIKASVVISGRQHKLRRHLCTPSLPADRARSYLETQCPPRMAQTRLQASGTATIASV